MSTRERLCVLAASGVSTRTVSSPMRPVAFLSMDGLDRSISYDHLAVPPLRDRGWAVTEVPWRADTDWNEYEAVLIRTPWDYQDSPEAFLSVLETIEASGARLANGLEVVRWNLDKTYLQNVERAGVPIVPTIWGENLTPEALASLHDRLGPEIVVKPTIGAGAGDTFRLRREASGDTAERAALDAFRRRPYMAQGFVASVVDEGEYSVFVFDGQISHTLLKTPASGDFRVQEEYGSSIRALAPEASLVAAAEAALSVCLWPLLYARVDLVRLPDGTWALMELELIEPSLYFPFAPGSADRFADAFDRWMRS